MFAAYIIERQYTTLGDLPELVLPWVDIFGRVALGALGFWLLLALLRAGLRNDRSLFYSISGRFARVSDAEVWKPRTFWLLLGISAVGLIVWGFFKGFEDKDEPFDATKPILLGACIAGALAVSWEFLLDLATLSGRRIWALARLSMMEAVRRRTLWSFVVILGVFLFASWFIDPRKKEDQWRTYVDLVFFVMTALLLITASVLACFSIPNDIKQQTIHTVITKPVRRFEIILGRIIGFTLLMTAVLAVVAHLSLLYVLRGIDDEAKKGSMRARKALYGNEIFFEEQGARKDRGENVGREWEHHQYIRGGSHQEAVWQFYRLPDDLKDETMIPVEFSFDIYRTSKGGEIYKGGVSCQVKFVNTNKWDYTKHADYLEGVDPVTKKRKESDLPYTPEERAEKYGYYELPQRILVEDYKTYTVWFPAAVLKDLGDRPFEIRVSCTSPNQYLGMNRFDLYVVAGEGFFYLNYLKGMSGIWFLMVLVITLGVVFSTYVNALVGLMLTWMLLFCGVPRIHNFVDGLSKPTNPMDNPGGGPLEAATRLFRGENMIKDLDKTPGIGAILAADEGFRAFFKGLKSILPDIGQFDRSQSIAEGFNIPGVDLAANVILLIAYLFPFLLLGYYLLNAREVAS